LGNQDTRKKLIKATKKILTESKNIDSLTARQISTEAQTNLAMINYCFKSKDELLKIAINEIVSEEFEKSVNESTDEKSEKQSGKEQLRNILYSVCDVTVKFSNLTKMSIPYILLNDEISIPYDILPFVKKIVGVQKDETECKIIAFQMIYIMQLIFYRSDDFKKYAGINIHDESQRHQFIDLQINLFLGGNYNEK